MRRNKIVTIKGAPVAGKPAIDITGVLVMLELGMSQRPFVIHEGESSRDVYLTDFHTGAKFGEILPAKGRSRKQRAQALIESKIDLHGVDRINQVIARHAVLNTDDDLKALTNEVDT